MVVPKEILAGQIEDMIIQRGGKILESFQLFDIYEGAQIRAGLQVHGIFCGIPCKGQDSGREQRFSAAMKKILNGLSSMGIELRQ